MTRWMRLHDGQMERWGMTLSCLFSSTGAKQLISECFFFRWRWWWVLEDGVRNCDKLPLSFLHAPYCQDERVLETISKYGKTFCICTVPYLKSQSPSFLYWSYKICCVITQVLTHRTRSSGRCLYGLWRVSPLKIIAITFVYIRALTLFLLHHPVGGEHNNIFCGII